MTRKSLQINIVVDSYNKLKSAKMTHCHKCCRKQKLNHRTPYGRKGTACIKNPSNTQGYKIQNTDQAKATDQAKGRETFQRNPPKQDPPLEPQVVVVPVDQAQDQDPPNPQNPQDTNPPPHIPNLPPPPNLPAHLQNLPVQPPNSEQPQGPPAHMPNTMQLPNPPPQAPMQSQNPPVQMPQLSWSYFKPDKPEEDAIAHLLRTNDWMETQNFPEEAKVQRFF